MVHRNPCLPCRDSSFSSGHLGLEVSLHTDEYLACMKTSCFILRIARELSDDVSVKSLLNDNESKVLAWNNILALSWHYQEL